MNHISKFTLAALLVLVPLTSFAGQRWEEMDYGRFLSATFNNSKNQSTFDRKGSAVNKGIAIKLGKDAAGTMLFDTDLLRVAGGWTGGFLKLQGVAFDGAHGPCPMPAEGVNMVFETNPLTPGWSKGEDFTDPRKKPTGPGAADIPFGPLPHDWAHYQGLYVDGDDIVLAYTVGTAPLLEEGGVEKAGSATILTRTFNVLGAGAASSLLVAEGQDEATATVDGNVVTVSDPKNPNEKLFISAAHLPAGAQFIVTSPARVQLKLPAFKGGEAFKVAYWKGGADQAKLVVPDAIANLVSHTKGGPIHWKETVTTKGEIGNPNDGYQYAVDTIALPENNPYNSWIRVGGFDFFKDGRVAFSTWSGDVWVGSGIDDKLQNITWKRYATGLYQALGLKIVDDTVYVLGRDQITRLHDLNGDGEADQYENFNNDVQVTPGFHEFAFDLQTDPEGNFYFVKGGPVNPGGRGWGPLSDHNGCVFKISKDGSKFSVFATGLRAPNGMGVGPHGEVVNGDNQGTWVPVDYINFTKQGDFIEVPDLSHQDPPPTEKVPTHLCWLPFDWDNSCGASTWVSTDTWGIEKDTLLYLSYGKCAVFRVLIDEVNGVKQGGVVKFPLKFDSGIMRARFNPLDHQLYVAGLRGWQTTASKDAAMQRVRYVGGTVTQPCSLHVTDKGIHIGFTAPLDPTAASDAQNFSVQQWNYLWSKEYGSPEFKVSNPKEKGRDDVEITSVKLSGDRKEIFLEIPDLQPVMQMVIKMNLKDANGKDISTDIANTINVVAKE